MLAKMQVVVIRLVYVQIGIRICHSFRSSNAFKVQIYKQMIFTKHSLKVESEMVLEITRIIIVVCNL